MHSHHRLSQRQKRTFWLFGLGSLIWLLLRSGSKPSRLTYPCQRAALATSSGFVGYLASVIGATWLFRRLARRASLVGVSLLALALLLTALLAGSTVPTLPARAKVADLPGWTSPTAVSDVFVAQNVPVPDCSLDGGTLPATPPCNDPDYALRDAGVDSLIAEMESRGTYFYQTTAHPDGVVGASDVVVIKINNQWAGNGDGDGAGRLCTNTDALKGLIWRILQHPDGFTGEVVVAENTQEVVWGWDITPANSQDQDQTYQDVVDAFQSLSYPVSLYRWDDLSGSRVSGGNVGDSGYPTGEYYHGNMTDAYILLEDPAGSGSDELSYPKFQTTGGAYVSMRYGVWDGAAYQPDQLTLINMPVLKRHGMAGATVAWKNLIGWITISDHLNRFGDPGDEEWESWDKMHGFFWGYQDVGDTDYGLLGRQMALVRAPDLNIVDAIWVAYVDNTSGDASRQDVLLASTDPFAVDWYASEYILRPLAGNLDETSAARGGTFRSATRVNQNAAAAAWSGSYPYMDLLDGYDGDTPSAAERNQMNVYVVGGGSACEALTEVGIGGPTVGFTNTLYLFSAVVTPSVATAPITYTWSPEPESGQGAPSAGYRWDAPGDYPIDLTAENCGGSDTATYWITISDVRWDVYLPLVLR